MSGFIGPRPTDVPIGTISTIGTVSANSIVVGTNNVTIGNAAYFVSNGNVGIGTSSPSYKLQIANGTVGVTGTPTQLGNTIGLTGNIVTSGLYLGFFSNPNTVSSVAQFTAIGQFNQPLLNTNGYTTVGYGTLNIPIAASSTGTDRVILYGSYSGAVRNSNNDISTATNSATYGSITLAGHYNSTNTSISYTSGNAFGLLGAAYNYNGTITNMYGGNFANYIGALAGFSGSSTTAYGVYTVAQVGAASGSGTGTLTNYYDAYLAGVTVAATGTVTNKYGVYQNATDHINYFGGNLGIGTNSPSNLLHVSQASTDFQARITGTSAGNAGSLRCYNDGGQALGIGLTGSTNAGYGTNLGFVGTITNNPLILLQNNTERMRLDSSGNLGLGVAPSAWTSTFKAFDFGAGGSLSAFNNLQIFLSQNAYYSSSAWRYTSAASASQYWQYGGNHLWLSSTGTPVKDGVITFNQNMTLDASGNMLLGGTSQYGSAKQSILSSSIPQISMRDNGATAGKYWRIWADSNNSWSIYNNNNAGVWLSDGGTSWNSSSDERLKDIISPISDAVKKVSSLRAVTFKWKNNFNDELNVGLIAQDVQAVLPEIVKEAPDGYLGLAYTDVIPLLVASIKELSAKLDESNLRIKALESK